MPERSTEPVSHVDDPLPRLERPSAVHGGRFLLGYAVVVLMVGAVIAALAFMTRDTESTATSVRWSEWVPQETGFERAREIAARISPLYRNANGEQLASVTAQPGEISGFPLEYITVRHGRNRALAEGDITVVEPGETALFNFCGLGGQGTCALPGEPTAERGALLRRQALELGLYTFRYLPDINTVVAMLPPMPREGQPPQGLAVVFQRRHLAPALNQPLTATLPGSPPYLPGDMTPEDAAAVSNLTELRFFNASFEQLPTQNVVLNLEVPTTR